MIFEYPERATPLDPDSLGDLIPGIATQGELNEFEARNILQAEQWALKTRGDNRDMLLVSSLRKLHRRMFDETWKWAGGFRRVETNIGIPWMQIPLKLEQFCQNTRYQIEHTVFPWVELAARFHHNLILIHPFPNGNGSHVRLATDLLLRRHGQARFTWGARSLTEPGETRREYITALREADAGDIRWLLNFVIT